MKFFSWIQSKFSARDGDKRGNAFSPTDEKNINPSINVDWPNGLLAIGTLGYKDDHTLIFENVTPELVERTREEENSSSDFSEFTTEQVRSLQKELTRLLRQKSGSKVVVEGAGDRPIDKFLNYPSSLELDRYLDSDNKDEGDIDRTIRIILGRCKDASHDKKMPRKSLCFLIKKIFACNSAPTLRRLTFQESRMEKLMRAMLKKKIHHQNSYEASPTKKCLEEERSINKWDKSDSEFIVLDI